MSPAPEPSTAQRLVGDIAPKLADLTDDVLFGDVWARPELARRDRSLVTVASLVTNGSTEQLVGHLRPKIFDFLFVVPAKRLRAEIPATHVER